MRTLSTALARVSLLFLILQITTPSLQAQFVPIGSGGYTTTFPGTDAAGRNEFPSGSPLTVGNAAGKPAPTNDWWSNKIKNNHSDNLFNYPYTLKTVNEGLVVTYIPWGVIDNITPVTVGVTGLSASVANVSDFSDWTVTMDWANAGHHFQATSGIGMPFLYFEKDAADVAQVSVTSGSVVIDNEMLIITDARNGADFAVYGPVGSVWTQNGTNYTSTLNGQNYWSMAFIPLDATSVTAVANEYKQYAYVFPTNTTTSWEYDEATAVVTTDFVVETDIKEGTDTTVLMGLLPHQWANLSAASPTPDKYSYASVRGELKTMAGNRFQVANTFHGILPTLPYLNNYSAGFSPLELSEKVQLLQNDGLAEWTDSYNEGQVMNRLIQTARIADQIGDTIARNKMILTVKTRLEDWLEAEGGEVAFLFYYNQTWSAMIGYPAGHGQDGNINDHHFHWGYFIHAAAFMEQFEPGWAAQYGEMINLLVRDAATQDRNDPLFPFLRNYSPYAGHCWANGFASFPQGNDQESTSESMQFNSSLIHWGSVTGNDSIRDLGIYMYTTEQSAVEEYWFDQNNRVFGPTQQYSLVSRVWGNSYDNGTFWTSDIAASYGIEMYPIHGGSLYLGHDTAYASMLWSEIEANTGILTNEVNPNLWHDVKWKYLSLFNPEKAIEMYNSYPDRSLKFGISDAQTYHWLHAMNVLGIVETSVTASHPLAIVFDKAGERIYTAQNYGDTAITVLFSDGAQLMVPANTLATSKDIALSGVLTSSFDQAYPGGSVDLSLQIDGGVATKVEFIDGETIIGTVTSAPYEVTATGLTVGKRSLYARIYDGDDFNISNLVTIVVGEQLPFLGQPIAIPGTVEPGHFDFFEGGPGQGISYSDVNRENIGGYRETEYVDAATVNAEGQTVGWISAGEWLEFTVDVQQAGNYSLDIRFASDNSNGGGPMRLESDGQVVKSGISFSNTNGWDKWQTKTVADVPLKSGVQVLRLFFEQGEFNLGKFTFTYSSALAYDQPIAKAGENVLVQLPVDTAIVDGSASSDPGNNALTYSWTQVYGPSTLVFSDPQAAMPSVSSLVEGVYLLRLSVDNGSYSDIDEVYIISSNSANVAPKVSILSPTAGSVFLEDASIVISATASDLIGEVSRVEFFADNVSIGSDTQSPYEVTWTPVIGMYVVTAIATDDDSSATTSAPVSVTVEEAPSCSGTSFNGDFDYRFSDDDNNPTLTFISSQNGVGSPTCILYYGTDTNNLPGYNVTPNVPYQLNASEGTTIYFYYTYSYPGAGEKNSSENKISYEIGSCKADALSIFDEELQVGYYPNPVTNILNLDLPAGKNQIEVYTASGAMMSTFNSTEQNLEIDMAEYAAGIYLVKMINGDRLSVFRIVKR